MAIRPLGVFGKTLATIIVIAIVSSGAFAEETAPEDVEYKHGYAYINELKYPADFTHFDYVNPDAPKGGEIRFSESGTWDSFNPATYKGRPQNGVYLWGHQMILYDKLFAHAIDEPSSYYGNLAEGVAYANDGKWIQYKLREGAYWHDGQPITVDDLVFTFETYRDALRVEVRTAISRLDTIEIVGEREVRIYVDPAHWENPVVPLALGNLPILPAHYWKDRDITKITVEPPLGSGPYKVAKFQVGRYIVWEKVANWWGKDLPVNKGRYNFERIRWDYFRDQNARFEAIKGNVVDVREETIPKMWALEYEFPAVQQGLLVKEMQEVSSPAHMWWPVLWNMRQERFRDIRVREALWLLYDFEWANDALEYGYWEYGRSFYLNSPLGHEGVPQGKELELLEAFRGQVPERVFTEPFGPPPHQGKGWHRDNLIRALELFEQAGWVLQDGALVRAKTGRPFTIKFITVAPQHANHILPYIEILKRVGIEANVRPLEVSNWLYRMRAGEFDGGMYWFLTDYTPGLALMNRFTTAAAEQSYGENYAHIKNPVVDDLVRKVFTAKNQDDFRAATRALDRVILWNFYYVPGRSRVKRALVYWDKFGRPQQPPLLRRSAIDTWWWDPKKAARVEAGASSTEGRD